MPDLPGGHPITAALILAAGASTRLGSPKQLVPFQGETLLDRAVRIAHESGCHPVLVVLGSSAEQIRQACPLRHAEVLLNEAWFEGMASSIRLGVTTLASRKITGATILPADMPSITPTHLRALRATGETTASRYADRNGIPAFFPRAAFDSLLTLEGDTGARALLQTAPAIDLEDGDLDIDTPESVTRMLSPIRLPDWSNQFLSSPQQQ